MVNKDIKIHHQRFRGNFNQQCVNVDQLVSQVWDLMAKLEKGLSPEGKAKLEKHLSATESDMAKAIQVVEITRNDLSQSIKQVVTITH